MWWNYGTTLLAITLLQFSMLFLVGPCFFFLSFDRSAENRNSHSLVVSLQAKETQRRDGVGIVEPRMRVGGSSSGEGARRHDGPIQYDQVTTGFGNHYLAKKVLPLCGRN